MIIVLAKINEVGNWEFSNLWKFYNNSIGNILSPFYKVIIIIIGTLSVIFDCCAGRLELAIAKQNTQFK